MKTLIAILLLLTIHGCEEATRLGLKPSAIAMRIKRGGYSLRTIHRINARVVLVDSDEHIPDREKNQLKFVFDTPSTVVHSSIKINHPQYNGIRFLAVPIAKP